MREILIAGNWKLNGSSQSITELVGAVAAGVETLNCSVAVCAPYIYVPLVSELLETKPLHLGAQDVSEHESGAYTGEVSAAMLSGFNCKYGLVGHSSACSN